MPVGQVKKELDHVFCRLHFAIEGRQGEIEAAFMVGPQQPEELHPRPGAPFKAWSTKPLKPIPATGSEEKGRGIPGTVPPAGKGAQITR